MLSAREQVTTSAVEAPEVLVALLLWDNDDDAAPFDTEAAFVAELALSNTIEEAVSCIYSNI